MFIRLHHRRLGALRANPVGVGIWRSVSRIDLLILGLVEVDVKHYKGSIFAGMQAEDVAVDPLAGMLVAHAIALHENIDQPLVAVRYDVLSVSVRLASSNDGVVQAIEENGIGV